jgi:hypothetical protein
MLQIMLAWMRTRQFIPTGIATDIDTFNRAARGAVSDQVPRMRQQSLLDKKPDVDLQCRCSSLALLPTK